MRGMLSLILLCTLAVSQLPNNRMTPAAASGGVVYAGADALNEIALPAGEEAMIVCENGVCRRLESSPTRSIIRTTVRTVTAPVRAVYAVRGRQVYRSSGPFMQRGPARRVCRGAARVVTAPIRWLRCR